MPISFPYKMSDWYGYDKDCTGLRQIYLTNLRSTNSTGMCGVATTSTLVYHNGGSPYPIVGDIIYSNQSGTRLGWINYKGVSLTSQGLAGHSIRVISTGSSMGQVNALGICP